MRFMETDENGTVQRGQSTKKIGYEGEAEENKLFNTLFIGCPWIITDKQAEYIQYHPRNYSTVRVD
jgi:hypothetical protein